MQKSAFLLYLACAAPLAAAAQQPASAAKPVAAAVPATYQDLMATTINELQAAHTLAATHQAIGKMERAAAAAPADWLPVYYQGLGYVHLAFLVKGEDNKDKYLDQAQGLIDRGLKLTRTPSELLVLQAYLYQARLSVSPMLRAMEYGPKVAETLKQAKQADPQNPRASYLMGSNLYYKPAMFGGGAEAAKPWLEQAVALYSSSRPATPISPRWGQSEALELLAQASSKK
jgi:hypothetical protein